MEQWGRRIRCYRGWKWDVEREDNIKPVTWVILERRSDRTQQHRRIWTEWAPWESWWNLDADRSKASWQLENQDTYPVYDAKSSASVRRRSAEIVFDHNSECFHPVPDWRLTKLTWSSAWREPYHLPPSPFGPRRRIRLRQQQVHPLRGVHWASKNLHEKGADHATIKVSWNQLWHFEQGECWVPILDQEQSYAWQLKYQWAIRWWGGLVDAIIEEAEVCAGSHQGDFQEDNVI